MEGWTDKWSNGGQRDGLFFPRRKQRNDLSHTQVEQGKGTADDLMPSDDWIFLFVIAQYKQSPCPKVLLVSLIAILA